MSVGTSRLAMVHRLERATGSLANAAIARMEQELSWYRGLGAHERSWIGLVIQAGVAAFVAWYREPGQRPAITADVFGTAPRELTRAISLHQTVELVRLTIDVVEEQVDSIARPEEAGDLRAAVLRYSREVAFAAAEVYARAAEARGAWDARLEALVVDALLRGEADEAVQSRAAALGWSASENVLVIVGAAGSVDSEDVVERVRRVARTHGFDTLAGVQGDRLLVVLGGVTDGYDGATVAAELPPGPVVVGPKVPDISTAAQSATIALSGLRAVRGWPDAPRPVAADDLLPERALAGDVVAREALVREVFQPLADNATALLETVTAFLEHGGSVEGTARALFVHPNTVRYRLRRVADLTGLLPTDPREAYVLRIALTLGRLADPQQRGGSAAIGSAL